MNKRPIPVTIIAWVYIATGAVGLVYHFRDLNAASGFRYDALWIELVRMAAVVCGAFMLRGRRLGQVGGHSLDRLSCNRERVPHLARTGDALFVLRCDRLDSASPRRCAVFSRRPRLGRATVHFVPWGGPSVCGGLQPDFSQMMRKAD